MVNTNLPPTHLRAATPSRTSRSSPCCLTGVPGQTKAEQRTKEEKIECPLPSALLVHPSAATTRSASSRIGPMCSGYVVRSYSAVVRACAHGYQFHITGVNARGRSTHRGGRVNGRSVGGEDAQRESGRSTLGALRVVDEPRDEVVLRPPTSVWYSSSLRTATHRPVHPAGPELRVLGEALLDDGPEGLHRLPYRAPPGGEETPKNPVVGTVVVHVDI